MLSIEDISLSYDKEMVLSKISFSLEPGQHLAIMGESGSGKSTLLKAVFGLLPLKRGSISWKDETLLGPDFHLIPGESFMKYVSQDFDLMPFTSVEENIAEYLSVFEQEHHATRVCELLELIGLERFAKEKVKHLSGGQKQRVALARALAQEPEVLLLDEPFSHIDHFKKNQLRHRLFPYLKEKGITVLTASHDSTDALSFSDTILVLKDGKVEDFQQTLTLYQNPKNTYVASLFGMVNTIPLNELKEYSKLDAHIIVYPHEFETSKKSGLKVTVAGSFFKGDRYLVEGISESGRSLFFGSKTPLNVGTKIFLNISLELVNKRLKVPMTQKALG